MASTAVRRSAVRVYMQRFSRADAALCCEQQVDVFLFYRVDSVLVMRGLARGRSEQAGR